jgi:2-polyprenyl-3-methyl-5-hydroxy-6-metoxy-1,4-benzoquinol methylase
MGTLRRRAYGIAYRAYYRYLFGKKIPLSEEFARWIRENELASGQHDIPVERDKWDAEYRKGDWDFLHAIDQLPRYAIIADYVRTFRRGAAVLDIGCGEGILQEKIGRDSYTRYLGIDISAAAVERAQSRADVNTKFLAGDAASFDPRAKFDVIIFNESLYYFDDPIAVLKRYGAFLERGGVFVASLYEGSYRSIAVQRLLETQYGELHRLWAQCGNKSSIVSIFSPRV